MEKLINSSAPVVVKTTDAETLKHFEFDIQTEEEKPFLRFLFEELQNKFNLRNISIINIDHQNYRERYTFERSGEKAVIDFEYNGKGFFGRVIPVENKCNSGQLLNEIKNVIKTLQQD